MLVLANKCDLSDAREVSVSRVENWALEHDAFYIDYSAKCGSQAVIRNKIDEIKNKFVYISNCVNKSKL